MSSVQGFPDWQEYTNQMGSTSSLAVNTSLAPQVYFHEPTSQWAGFDLHVFAPTNPILVEIVKQSALNGGSAIGTERWHLWGGSEAAIRCTNRAVSRYVQVTGSVAAQPYTLYATNINAPMVYQRIPDVGVLTEGSIVSIAAGATQTFNLIPYRGPAWFWYRTQAATSVVGLNGFDYLGVQRTELFRGLNLGTSGVLLHIPSECVQLSMQNNDAAAKNFSWAVVGIL